MKKYKFSLYERVKSIGFALNGIKILIKEEHNSRIHFIAAILVISSGIWLKLSVTEWMVITFSIGLVLILETINSTIENLADYLSTEYNSKIKKIKDLSAASVLIGSITAVCIGIFIFLPKIIKLCSNC